MSDIRWVTDMINKTFSKILTLGLSIVLITSVLTTFVFYKNYEQQEKRIYSQRRR